MVSKSEVEPSAVSYIQNLNHFKEPELEGTRYQNNIRSLTKSFISHGICGKYSVRSLNAAELNLRYLVH